MGVMFMHEGSKHVVGFEMKDNLHTQIIATVLQYCADPQSAIPSFPADGDGMHE